MKIPFTKYQGTGNDFVMINGFQDAGIMFKLNSRRIKSICDRHFGIGADGLIILAPDKSYDFQMIYYNSDGQASSMCGNGGRCIAHFANKLGLCGKHTQFRAIDGEHEAIINEQVSLKMMDVDQLEDYGEDVILNTGSPHFIHFVESMHIEDFVSKAREIRLSKRFSEEGINVNFIRVHEKSIHMRTYERGVEDETLSCGTGVVAASLAAHYKNPSIGNKINIITEGGELKVSFVEAGKAYKNIWLKGAATEVFKGVITLGP